MEECLDSCTHGERPAFCKPHPVLRIDSSQSPAKGSAIVTIFHKLSGLK